MLENHMTIGNRHDSSKKDFDQYCTLCEGEIYHGMTYWEFYDHLICEECRDRALDELGERKVAGEE
jgi:hypothetical protein